MNTTFKSMIYEERGKPEMLAEGIYENFHYAIVSYGSHPCAYIELPENHKYYGKDYNDIPIDCHGGLTYSSGDGIIFPTSDEHHRNGYWIGWDYAHYTDYYYSACCYFYLLDESIYQKQWTTEEIFSEVKDVIEQLKTV